MASTASLPSILPTLTTWPSWCTWSCSRRGFLSPSPPPPSQWNIKFVCYNYNLDRIIRDIVDYKYLNNFNNFNLHFNDFDFRFIYDFDLNDLNFFFHDLNNKYHLFVEPNYNITCDIHFHEHTSHPTD
ncbi:hypothetical protein SCHPADRAFT_52912 [Schizopora paradoxa]|uniref:Uncharacterized protein n=1 Tax=Schizopora paradoxa TaxID=27342 RepID=A0A0H2SRE8_9AGAM|nr:hypothetical protein SCHPADRAFT_52912 [Schizopora paradoxa]